MATTHSIYRKRRFVNALTMVLSGVATAFGLLFLGWILLRLTSQERRKRPDVRLRRLVDDDQVEQAHLGRNGFGHAPLWQYPARHGLICP